MGALSGDFESLEVTESQQIVIDLLKSFGKMSAIVADSTTRYKVERMNGLENFAYRQQLHLEKGSDMKDPEVLRELDEARYETVETKVGNKTEFLRVILAPLANDREFREMLLKVVTEQKGLAYKRRDNRGIAESSTAQDYGL